MVVLKRVKFPNKVTYQGKKYLPNWQLTHKARDGQLTAPEIKNKHLVVVEHKNQRTIFEREKAGQYYI